MTPLGDREYIVLEYKSDMLEKPVLRSAQGCKNNDNEKAWTYQSCHQALQGLAFRAGYRYPITSYFMRRGVANALYRTISLSLS